MIILKIILLKKGIFSEKIKLKIIIWIIIILIII